LARGCMRSTTVESTHSSCSLRGLLRRSFVTREPGIRKAGSPGRPAMAEWTSSAESTWAR
jgi:hypothetical protein